MSLDVITVRNDVTLAVVVRYLQLHEDLPDQTEGLMVIDREGFYQGKLLLNKVLTHNKNTLVKDAVNTQYELILAMTDEHEIAHFLNNIILSQHLKSMKTIVYWDV